MQQPAWMQPRLQGLTFCFTGEMYKDPHNRPRFRGDPMTVESLRHIIEREGGTVLDEIGPNLNYLLRLGQNYPPTLRREIDDMNNAGKTSIRQYELSDFFEELLRPGRMECLEMLRGGKQGAARFSELMQYAPSWRRVDIRGNDMRNFDLEGVDFEHVVLDSLDLRGANLAGAKLSPASKVLLDGANLAGAEFRRLTDSSLVGANLTGATNCRLLRCNLNGANLSGAKLEECSECSCQNAILDKTTWPVFFKLNGNDFSGASLRHIWFGMVDFAQSNLRGANVENSTFMQATMPGMDLRDAKCRGALFGYTNLSGAQVAGADFTGATLRMTNLDGVDIDSAIGLAEAWIVPRGTIGPKVDKLERLCTESKRVSFQGIAETDRYRIDFQLHFDQRSSAPPVKGEWVLHDKWAEGDIPLFIRILGGVDPSRYTEYLMAIAGYWTDATIQWDSLKITSSKAPLKGRGLRDVVIAALCEAWGHEPPQS